jgi:ankyrin repeat protein
MLARRGDVAADRKDNELWTPLWRAAFSGHKKVARVLLDIAKANPDSTDKDGETAALAKGHE